MMFILVVVALESLQDKDIIGTALEVKLIKQHFIIWEPSQRFIFSHYMISLAWMRELWLKIFLMIMKERKEIDGTLCCITNV